eukprot:3096999-Amphidinium_carterae.1
MESETLTEAREELGYNGVIDDPWHMDIGCSGSGDLRRLALEGAQSLRASAPHGAITIRSVAYSNV